MNFINPHEISGKILTLIEEAQEELIIVSPYVKIKEWYKLKKALQKAVKNDVKITFVARENCNQDLSDVFELGIEPILKTDLHAKLYINENTAIVTSHNLYHYSEANSLEIGHFTNEEKEIKELIKFVDVNLLEKPENSLKFVEKKKNVMQDDFVFIKEWEVEKLHEFFQDKYPRKNIVGTSSYIYNEDILGFCDLMISGKYIIKLWRNSFDESIIDKIEKLKFPKLNYEYFTEKDTKHPRYIYLEFLPKRKYARDKYFEDFFTITETLKKNKHKIRNQRF